MKPWQKYAFLTLSLTGPPDICDSVELHGFQRVECTPSLLEIARNTSELTLSVAFLEAAGLDGLLACAGPFTALLPSNDAFTSLGRSTIEELLDTGNRDILRGLLLYHMLGQELSIDEFKAGNIEMLLDGAMVSVAIDPLQLNDASVEKGDIGSCNGIIHVIDDVLLPEVIGKLSMHDRRNGLTIFLFQPEPTSRPIVAPTLRPTTVPTILPTAGPTIRPTSLIVAPTLSPSAAPTFDCSNYDFGGSSTDCSPNMLGLAAEDPDLDIAVRLFEIAGLTPLFSCPGPFTALFPVNGMLAALLLILSYRCCRCLYIIGTGSGPKLARLYRSV